MSSLSDTDFAKAGLDLTSWVLEDDLYHNQDFCHVAKDAQSISAGTAEEGSSFQSLIGSQDVPMDIDSVEWSDACKLDEYFPLKQKETAAIPAAPVAQNSPFEEVLQTDDLDLQQLIKEEIVLQQKTDQLQFFKQQEEQELLRQQKQQELLRKQQEAQLLQEFEEQVARQTAQQLLEQQQLLLQSPVYSQPAVQEISYQDSFSVPSISVASTSSSPVYYASSPTTSEVTEEVDPSGPYIISVPVSAALIEDFNQSSPLQASTSQFVIEEESHPISYDGLQQEHPQHLVINVKKVKKSKAQPVAPTCSVSGFPTLKEALEGNEADEFLQELIDSPRAYGNSAAESSVTSCGEESSADDLSVLSPSSCRSVTPIEILGVSYPPRVKGCRGNPYSLTEKRLRKKEQNKRAALRYRQKKKDEEGDVLMTLRKEEDRQKQLLEKYESVRTELKLMKKLAREMLVAQGKLPK